MVTTDPVGPSVNSSSHKQLNGVSGYDMNVAVLNRRTYQFANSLRVSEVAGIMGNLTYTCIIQNRFGQDSQNISFDNTGEYVYTMSYF